MRSNECVRVAFNKRSGRMATGATSDGQPMALSGHWSGRLPSRPSHPVPQRRHRNMASATPRDRQLTWEPRPLLLPFTRLHTRRTPRKIPRASTRISSPACSRRAVRCPERAELMTTRHYPPGRTWLHRNSRTAEGFFGRGAPAYSANPNLETAIAGGRPIRPSGHCEGSIPSVQGRPAQASMQEVLPTPALTQASNSRSVHWSDRSTDREESAPLVVDSLVRHWGGTFRSQPPSHEEGETRPLRGK